MTIREGDLSLRLACIENESVEDYASMMKSKHLRG